MHPLCIFIMFLIFQSSLSKTVEIKCPAPCTCDFFENYKRATCVDKKIAVIENDLPKETQILDISYNQISNLDDHTFFEQNLVALKLLNISHNKVGQIHMNAFEGLTKLKTLDLSYNAMQYLIPHWFYQLSSLRELYLRGNYFGEIGQDPQFESKSLIKLDLSLCKISYIGADAFLKIPGLEILDISENILISLNVSVIKPLTNLTIFKTNNNTFGCNQEITEVANYCTQKGISFKNPCAITSLNSDKFERMVNLAPEIEDEKNSWIFDDEEEDNIKIVEVCNNNVTNSTNINKGMILEIINLSPVLSVLITFIYGIAVGILIGCTVQIRGRKRENLNTPTYESYDEGGHLRRTRSASILRGRSNNRNQSEITENLVLSEWNITESTPVMSRKK